MRHAPVEDFGFGILDPYTLQCCSWIQSIVDHIWTSSPTGALLTVAAEDAQLEMGLISYLSMQPSWDPLCWLTTSLWIRSCLQFMWTNQIWVKPFGTTLTPARHSNKGIMEAFASFIDDTSTLSQLNRCCMQKKVVWLSDLFTPDGKMVQEASFTSKECVYSPFQWPLKHHTTTADWSLWTKCLLMLQDRYTLGPWTLGETEYYQQSTALVTQSGNTLFLCHPTQSWTCHSIIQKGPTTRSLSFRTVGFVVTTALPPNYLQVSLTNLTSTDKFTISPMATAQEQHTADSSSPLSCWTHQYVNQSDTTSQLLQDFSNSRAQCGSDGSFVPQWMKGSFAWRIESENGTEFVEGGGIIPGPPEAQCLFCSKIGGVTGIVQEVSRLETLTSPAPILLTGCDSLSTLHRCMSPQDSVKTRWAHCDLLSHLQASIHANTSMHAWMHIKSHQTQIKPRSQLSRNALLNEDMDALVTKIMEAFPKADPFQPSIGMPTVHFHKVWIMGNVKQSLYCLIARQLVKEYLEDRKVIESSTYDMIDWISIRRARGSNHNQDLCMSKVICNQLPTLQILCRRKHITSDNCPFCAVATEDLQHIYRCPHVAQQDQWKEQLLRLAQWLQEQLTEPGLRQLLIIMLNRWHNHKSALLFRGTDPILNRAAWDQHAIGWFAFLKGFIAKSIVTTQHAYFQYIGSLQSGTVWAAALCKQLWTLFESLWDKQNSFYHKHLDTGKHDLCEALSISITNLYHQLDALLPPQYAPFFKTPLQKLLDSGLVDQKNWFSLILTTHKQQGSASSTIFSVNSTPRQWAGLPPIRPLCPHLLIFADDQLWITTHQCTTKIILTYYQSDLYIGE